MSNPTAPPAGWYDDPSTPGRQRWYDGAAWTEHYQTRAAAVQVAQPVYAPVPAYAPAPVAAPSKVKQSRDKAQYVRQQKGHSIVLHLILGIFVVWINVIYISASPNHYWHT